uniref:energy transducer TonB n=1 Tax=Alistipes sp. TaxID=1872444 RepID=UPI004055BB24
MKLASKITIFSALLLLCTPLWAQRPLYVVNGEPREEMQSIPPEMIERIESLPADEQTIARYGEAASNGVILITLIYDQAPQFVGGEGSPFEEWIAAKVAWGEEEPTARVVVRYDISTEGVITMGEVLDATDKRLLRRVRKAIEQAPRWQPATKDGKAVAYHGVLHLQLPTGRPMPHERYIIIR